MLAAIGSTPYKIVFLLHILSAFVAFAPAFVWPIVNVQTRKRGVKVPAEVAGQVPVNNVLIHGPALVLTGLFGLAMVLMSEDVWEFSQAWISGAFLVFFALLGVLFGLLVPAERKAAAGDADAARKVSMFGGFVHTLLLVMLYLMIFKPGPDLHPIEHLRYVARAGGADPVDLASEAAHALGAFDDDPAGLVAAARQLVARHRAVGPLWWLCSRVLVAPEPMAEGLRAARELEDDATDGVLAAFLPDEARVLIVGWPPTVVPALARRGDLDVLAADDGTGVDVGRALGRVDIPVLDVTSQGVGAAAATVDVVLLEASAAGPEAALCAPGSRAAAAVARAAGRTVWLVTPVGRVLPRPTYEACAAGAVDADEPWESDLDVVPLDLVDRVVGLEGPVDVAVGVGSPGCPVAPELLVRSRTPGSFQG